MFNLTENVIESNIEENAYDRIINTTNMILSYESIDESLKESYDITDMYDDMRKLNNITRTVIDLSAVESIYGSNTIYMVSNEGIADTIRGWIAKLMEWAEKLFKNIASFFNNIKNWLNKDIVAKLSKKIEEFSKKTVDTDKLKDIKVKAIVVADVGKLSEVMNAAGQAFKEIIDNKKYEDAALLKTLKDNLDTFKETIKTSRKEISLAELGMSPSEYLVKAYGYINDNKDAFNQSRLINFKAINEKLRADAKKAAEEIQKDPNKAKELQTKLTQEQFANTAGADFMGQQARWCQHLIKTIEEILNKTPTK